MIDEALEVEYNIRRRHPESPGHYARFTAESAAARRDNRCMLDLPYGPASGARLDFFPASRSDAPLFLFIHGGYWRALDKSDFSFIAPSFVATGAAVALINYDLAPGAAVEEIVAQTQGAISWVHENAGSLGFDPRRLFVGGHSAGGHLTAMALLAEPRLPIAGGIAISGLFDLVPLLGTNVNDAIRLDEVRARRLSPLYHARPDRAPCLIAVGGAESAGFIAQSKNFAAAVGIKAQIYPADDHYTIMHALARPESEIRRAIDAAIEG